MVFDVPEPVQRRLDQGEHVEWWGQPRQGLFFRPIDAFLIPFTLLWAGIPTVGFVAALASGNYVAMLPILLFLIPGMYLSWGRFVIDISVRRGLYYAITDSRCLLVGTKWRKVTRTFGRGSVDIELVEHSNGLGTIRFIAGSVFNGRRNPWGDWFTSFEQIPNAAEVYRMARVRPQRDLLERPRHPKPPGIHGVTD